MKKDPSSEKREAKVKMKYIGSINTKEKLCPSKLDSRGFRVKSHDVLGEKKEIQKQEIIRIMSRKNQKETLREIMENVMISWIQKGSKLLDTLAREFIPHEECKDLSIYKGDILMHSVKRCDNNSTKMFQMFQEKKVRKCNESMETNDPNLPSIVILREKWAQSNIKESESRMVKERTILNIKD